MTLKKDQARAKAIDDVSPEEMEDNLDEMKCMDKKAKYKTKVATKTIGHDDGKEYRKDMHMTKNVGDDEGKPRGSRLLAPPEVLAERRSASSRPNPSSRWAARGIRHSHI